MSGLNALKLVQAKREKGNSPQHARRQKLSTKLAEQIQLAKAQQSGTEFSPVRVRTVKDEATGQSRKVEVPKKLKPWWWTDEKGKLCVTIRYGARILEIVEGKNAIETDNIADVIASLQVIRSAVDSGELDARIEAISGLMKSGFDKETQASKRQTLKLPSKSA
jgi:proline racemase